MNKANRVLAVGGDRAKLVDIARAFQAAGGVINAASTVPLRLIESASSFNADLILIFAEPSPHEAMRQVAFLRTDPRYTSMPVVLVSKLQMPVPAGFTRVMAEQEDSSEFTACLIKLMEEIANGSASEARPAAPTVVPQEPRAPREEIPELPPLGSRILLVDDDPALVRLFSLIVQKSGFAVVSGSNGVEGLEQLYRYLPDLVIADLNMPKLDGWGLLRTMRADHRIAETPLIFMSCHEDYSEGLKARKAGAQEYIAKGGKLDFLVSRVRALLAPRDAFLGSIITKEHATARVEEVGVQWTLRRMALARSDGMLEAHDSFWTVKVSLKQGQIISAHASIGSTTLTGEAALAPLIALSSGELEYFPDALPGPIELAGETRALLHEAAVALNATEEDALNTLMAQATAVEIDDKLYQLYEQLGPPNSKEIAVLVRQGLTPREVVAKMSDHPLEVERSLRDLLRRRVLRLRV